MTLDKSSAAIRRMFGEIARRYDLLNHLLSLGIDRRWRQRTVRIVAPPADDAWILDVCTGTGDLALAYCRATGKDSRVVGTDFCRPMLARAEAKRRRAGLRRGWTSSRPTRSRCPFATASSMWSAWLSGCATWPTRRRGCGKWRGSAVRGGKSPCWNSRRRPPGPPRPLYRWYFRHILPRVGQAVAGNRAGRLQLSSSQREPVPPGRSDAGADAGGRPGGCPQPCVQFGHLHLVPSSATRRIMKRNIVVAITGASGVTYAVRLLEVLSAAGCDVHLVISPAAQAVLKQELDLTVDLDNFTPAHAHARQRPEPQGPQAANDPRPGRHLQRFEQRAGRRLRRGRQAALLPLPRLPGRRSPAARS